MTNTIASLSAFSQISSYCGLAYSISVTVDIYKHWIPSANRDAVNRLPSINTIMKASQGVAAD